MNPAVPTTRKVTSKKKNSQDLAVLSVGRSGKGDAGQVRAVVRALTILRRLSQDEYGLSLSDLALSLGLPQSTAHRLLTTLQQERFVRFDAERALWVVGVDAFIVGSAFLRSRNLVAIAHPFMQELMSETKETANLAVENNGVAFYVAQVECDQLMRVFVGAGSQAPLHCSGVGKAILSALSDDVVAKILRQRGLPRLTEHTIVSPSELRTALKEAREQGYAIDDEEQAQGLRCIASVIYDEHGAPLAAVSVSGPKARLADADIPVLGAKVRETAAKITKELGGMPPLF